MSRNIIIDGDTEVGYSFLKKDFYITNKATTTWRQTKEEAKEVLDIVAPKNKVTLQDLDNLVENLEEIKDLFYTWSPTGSFIASIQFNDYEDYILILDCLKKKLYFRNSNLIFDLSLSERKLDRILLMCSYLRDRLGISIDKDKMDLLYELLIKYYKPNIHNVLSKEKGEKGELMYSNVFKVSDFTDTARAIYTCTSNPKAETYLVNIANIENMKVEKSVIQLTKPIEGVSKGSIVHIEGSKIQIENDTYTNDGTYKVESVSLDKKSLTVSPKIKFNMDFIYPRIHLITSELDVSNVNRDTSTITLTNTVPDSIKIGDVIYLNGTAREENYETVSADGKYVVANIDRNTIIIQELFPSNYNYVEGTYPTISKRISLGKIKLIENKKVSTVSQVKVVPSVGAKVIITRDNIETFCTVASANSLTVTVNEEIEDYTPVYAELKKVFPKPNILIDVAQSNNIYKLPIGEFMVDNFEQCKQYVRIYNFALVPSDEIYEGINNPVPTRIHLSKTIPDLKLLGIFNEVYKKEEDE